MLTSKMKSSKEKKIKGIQFKGPSTKVDKTNLPKEFKWMGFKSHMLATMAKWREVDFLTDAAFQCVRFLYLIYKILQKFPITFGTFLERLKIFKS